jgi:hypothetical protein
MPLETTDSEGATIVTLPVIVTVEVMISGPG